MHAICMPLRLFFWSRLSCGEHLEALRQMLFLALRTPWVPVKQQALLAVGLYWKPLTYSPREL